MSNENANALAGATPGAILPRGNASTMVAQTREMADALAAVQMAKMFPRDMIAVRDRILNACTRPKLAEVACYTYARGGTEVTGPSIRLAEMLAQCWGNMQFGIRELEQKNGESTCEAFAWDLETNARQVKVFQVPHIRYTRQGAKPLSDPRDVYELVMNQGARRLRACILGVIPGDIVDEAVAQCDVTLATKFEVTPERVKAMLDKFAELGVTKEQIEARIQRRVDAITPALLADLGKKYNSIKDGMSKPEDWFPKTPAPAQAPQEPPKDEKKAMLDALKVPAKKKPAKAPADDVPPPKEAQAPAAQGGEEVAADLLDIM